MVDVTVYYLLEFIVSVSIYNHSICLSVVYFYTCVLFYFSSPFIIFEVHQSNVYFYLVPCKIVVLDFYVQIENLIEINMLRLLSKH